MMIWLPAALTLLAYGSLVMWRGVVLWRETERQILSRTRTFKRLMKSELMAGHAELSVVVTRADGTVEDRGVVATKKVTGAFVTFLVAQMVTDTSEIGDFKYHDCGEDNTAEANTQTGLLDAFGGSRVAGTQVAGGTGTAPTYTSVATINFSGSFAIVEHGLFSQSSGGTICDRSVFAPVNVGNGDSIQFTYVLTLNAEA